MYVSVHATMIMGRDTCLHAYGVDCLLEHGKILLIGNSVLHEHEGTTGAGGEEKETTIYRGANSIIEKVVSHTLDKACPWRPSGWGRDRMHVHDFTGIIEITGPESATPVIIAKVDPNVGKFKYLEFGPLLLLLLT